MAAFDRSIRQLKALLPERVKSRVKMTLGVPNVEFSLLNMKRNGFSPRVVIDVGAYRGDWTSMCKHIFPAARVLMIEPQEARKDDLKRVLTEFPDVALECALAGSEKRAAVGFYAVDSASSVLPEVETNRPPAVFLSMRTLDAIVEATPFEHPDFIKLDVQGYELEVLKGAKESLISVEAVLMEVNLIEINKGAPLFHEVVGFMAEKGFQLYDICSFFRRPYDGALWQVDAIFVKKSSPLVSSKRWA